ncbi:MAG: hypothetical protein D6772_06745 [Bacteroidetes bacterium]|nr:MAG: hypothetical protein D6772_06745 [Bacteroidota bacterium]
MRNYVILLFSLALVLALQLEAQTLNGIFRPSDAKLAYIENANWPDFLQQHQALSKQGFRLTQLESAGRGQDRRYWGILLESVYTDTLLKVNSWAEMVKAKRALAKAGFLLTTVQAYAISESDAHYIGVWRKDDDATPHKLWKLDSPESLQAKTEEMAAHKYYVQSIEVFLSPSGTATYLPIYYFSPIPVRNYVAVHTDEEAFLRDHWQRTQSQVRLIDYEHFTAKENTYYLGIYQPGQYPQQLLRRLDAASFNAKWEQLERENLHLVGWEIRE